jgi:hypothetical protein
MPRPPRLDASGTLHLVMGRGIDRAKIFRNSSRKGSARSTLNRRAENEDGSFYGMRSFAEASTSEESGAGKPHVRFCTGGAG